MAQVKSLREQIAEVEAEYGIDVAALRKRGAAARKKALEEEVAALVKELWND